MKNGLKKLGIMATLAGGAWYSVGGLEAYAQDVPRAEVKQVSKESKLEKRLVDVPDKIRFDVFNRLYDVELNRKYEKVTSEDMEGYFDSELVKMTSPSILFKGPLRAYFIHLCDISKESFSNPKKVISNMDKEAKELFEKYDATGKFGKSDKDFSLIVKEKGIR